MTTIEFLDDPKTKKLSGGAFKVWIYARTKFNPKKPSLEFSLTGGEMKDMMSKKALTRGLNELIAAKFIERIESGKLFKGKSRYKFIGDHRYFYTEGKAIKNA